MAHTPRTKSVKAKKQPAPSVEIGEVAAPTKRPLALVVDDDETFVELVCLMIGTEFDVCVAYNGSDALREFEHRSPDLVITDIVMPRLDGFVLISELRRLTDKPILAVSGGISDASARVLAGLGTDFVGKHQIHDELLKRARKLLASYERRHGRNTSPRAG